MRNYSTLPRHRPYFNLYRVTRLMRILGSASSTQLSILQPGSNSSTVSARNALDNGQSGCNVFMALKADAG